MRNQLELTRLGWEHMIVWECQLSNIEELKAEIGRYLNS